MQESVHASYTPTYTQCGGRQLQQSCICMCVFQDLFRRMWSLLICYLMAKSNDGDGLRFLRWWLSF